MVNRLTPICSASISVRSSLPKRTDHALQAISPNYHFKMQLLASTSSTTCSREVPHADLGHCYESITAGHVSPKPSLQAIQYNPTSLRVGANVLPPTCAAGTHGAAQVPVPSTGPFELPVQRQRLGGLQHSGIMSGTGDKMQSFRWYSSAAATPYADSKSFSSGL